MTRRNLLIFVAAAVVTFAAVVLHQNFFNVSPSLTVHLRCGENTHGTLSVATKSATQTFDAAEACRTGAIKVGGYRQGEEARLSFENKNGGRGDLVVKYGADIQSEPQGFHVIVKITNEPPSIGSEKL